MFTPCKSLSGNSRYEELKEEFKEIKIIIRELLRLYGSSLTYNHLKKLEYLDTFFYIDMFLDNHFEEINGQVKIDKRYLKVQALVIYKAYYVLRNEKFIIPDFQIEKEIRAEFV